MRRFGIFCAAVMLLFAVFGVLAIKAARAETATWWGEDSDFDAARAGSWRKDDPQACADYPQATCTCADSRFALGTHLKVTYHGRSVVCRVNDIRPFDWTDAELVLSFGAARVLGIVGRGTARVSIKRMGRLE